MCFVTVCLIFRIKAYSRASKLGNQLGKMQQIVSALKENKNEMKAKVDKHSSSVRQHMKDIQVYNKRK